MHIELLVVPDCPNEAVARDLVNSVLAEHGLVATVATLVIGTDGDARDRGFPGSPTFLIDGDDPFPSDGTGVGLTCRLYRTAHGLAGLPGKDDLARAVLAAVASAAPAGGGST